MENIKVFCRCRPLNEREILSCEDSIWHISQQAKNINLSHFASSKINDQKRFQTVYSFDSCFDENYDNISVYSTSIKPSLACALDGISCTFMVYGQTGAGKTFTMNGPVNYINDDVEIDFQRNPGVLFQSALDIIQMIEESGKEVILRVSFVEIYNDQIFDLLGNINASLNLVEDVSKHEFIIRGFLSIKKGVNEVKVNSIEEIADLLKKGETNRHYAENFMNHLSSRSHTVFKFHLTIVNEETLITSNLNFVDLAGSERLSNYEVNPEIENFEFSLH